MLHSGQILHNETLMRGTVACAQTQGGGNCANALTAAARLGLAPALVTKLGGDAVGDGIVEELNADGVDTKLVLRQAGAPSPFTYIIVDAQGGVSAGLAHVAHVHKGKGCAGWLSLLQP